MLCVTLIVRAAPLTSVSAPHCALVSFSYMLILIYVGILIILPYSASFSRRNGQSLENRYAAVFQVRKWE